MRLFSFQPSACLVWYFVGCTGLLGTFLTDAVHKVVSSRELAWEDLSFHNPRNRAVITNILQEFSKGIFASDWGFLLLVNFILSAYAFLGVMTTVVFLGQLTAGESRRLTERLAKHLVFKVVFVGAVMKPEFQKMVLWLVWFAVTAYLKMFVGAAKDRLEALMGYPHPLPTKHMRAMGLLLVLLAVDAASIVGFWSSKSVLGWTYFLLFAFDTAIIAVEGMKTLVHYGIYLLDRIVAWESGPESLGTWEAWNGKGSFLYHTELVADVLMHLMTLLHYLQIWFLHGLTFHVVDAILFLDVRSIMVSMHRRMRGYAQYRAANHNLNHSFPDACESDLSHPCAICFDRMAVGKKLPCGHVFHLACLRAWLQQSSNNFTCPMCRKPLFIPQHSRAGNPENPFPALPPIFTPLLNAFDRLLTLLFPGFFSVPWNGYENHVAWVMAEARRREERDRRLAAREAWFTGFRERAVGWMRSTLARAGGPGGVQNAGVQNAVAPQRMEEVVQERRPQASAAFSVEPPHYPDLPSTEEEADSDSDSLHEVSTWTGSTISAAVRSLSCTITVSTAMTRGGPRPLPIAEEEDEGGEVSSRPSPSVPQQPAEPAPSYRPAHRYPTRRHATRR